MTIDHITAFLNFGDLPINLQFTHNPTFAFTQKSKTYDTFRHSQLQYGQEGQRLAH